jgi:hypothetical protein
MREKLKISLCERLEKPLKRRDDFTVSFIVLQHSRCNG